VSTLQSYLQTTRFILHDVNSVTFTDSQLTNCINLARDRIVTDTYSPQALPFIPLISGQDAYPFSYILPYVQALPASSLARAIQAILFVNFVQTPTPPYIKIPLRPLPFNVLNERYRINPVNSLCEAFGVLDLGSIVYLEPPPAGNTFQAEIRCTWLPVYMVNYTDQETAIPAGVSDALVPLMAASWAWENNDDMESSKKMEDKYTAHLNQFGASMPPYLYDPYSSIY